MTMQRILMEIKTIIDKNINLYLPHVKAGDLEANGAVFYMNSKNGTEFDWFVNEKISDFMVFYNDEDNLGALKLTLYQSGTIILYVYDEKGKKLIKEINLSLNEEPANIFKLAVILKNQADDKKIWDGNIESIDTDLKIDDQKINEFISNQKYYHELKNKLSILNLKALVSKKILEDNWNIGYMERNDPYNDQDSGWSFLAGNEDDQYVSNYKNIQLVTLGYVCNQIDPNIFKYIDKPVGTKMIRVSKDEFEIDKNNQEIFIEKR